MNSAITSIEFGTTKLVVLISRSNKEGIVELLGLGNVSYDGVQGDNWQSTESIRKSVTVALGQAQKMAGFKINHCTLGIPNEFCGLIRNTKEIPLNHPVTKQDVLDLRKLIGSYSLPSPWRISEVVNGSFIINDYCVGNPLGMVSDTLGLEASLVCINNDFSRQMIKLLSTLRIRVNRIIPVPMAYSEALITQTEKQNGAILIDIGGHSTDIAVYKNGMPVLFDWLPVGGNTITQDIVKGARVTFEEAERLKRYCVLGLALTNQSSDGMDMPVRIGRNIHNIPLDLLQEIVEARIEEILELVKEKVAAEALLSNNNVAILVGGGISLFRGVKEFGSGILGIPFRLGVPDIIGLSSPAFSTAYSLAQSSVTYNTTTRLSLMEYGNRLFKSFKLKF